MPEGQSLFNRLRALFLRYASHHDAMARGVGLPRYRLRRLGNIERVCADGDGIRLIGWTSVEQFELSWPVGSLNVRPDLPRPDVINRSGGLRRNMGFDVALPQTAHPILVSVRLPTGHVRHVTVHSPDEPVSARSRRRLRRAFFRDMIRALPAFAAFAVSGRECHKQTIKATLGLTRSSAVPRLDPHWFHAPPSPATPPPFTIIMPVHNGFELMSEALDRVARHTDGDWRIVVVDDASTDPRVAPWLNTWCAAQGHRAEVITLQRNAGFVAAVNHGLSIAEDRKGPVVLLNSDALVPPGWAERLLEPLADTSVASVTPFSNEAEIFSVPVVDLSAGMHVELADQIDEVARTLGAPAILPEAPTGVGFCMAMSRDWLARVPRLDPAFGRGYGEETDWCQRVGALGGCHVGQPRLFVYHAGGASFGAEKTARVAQANAMIRARYPGYDGAVQRFIQSDPLRTARLTLAIAQAGFATTQPLPVYLAHSLGGGADLALERDITRDLATVGAAVVLRVGGVDRFTVELRLRDRRLDGATSDFGAMRRMLAAVPRLRIVYSCGVGDPHAHELPRLLLQLRRDVLTDRCEARLHDYFPISPSYCLLGGGGVYRGPVRGRSADPAHGWTAQGGQSVSLKHWQDGWRDYLTACDVITAFSQSSAAIFHAAYPSLSHRVRVQDPAPLALPAVVVPRNHSGALGVLGNLNAQKGARVVGALARRLDAMGDGCAIVVIGNVDATFSMPARVRIHGGYRREEIATLTRRYGISTWIVPAVWPETYSFTTREALATGLPVIAFDLGAQGEAVSRASNGVIVPYDPDADLAARLLKALPAPHRASEERGLSAGLRRVAAL